MTCYSRSSVYAARRRIPGFAALLLTLFLVACGGSAPAIPGAETSRAFTAGQCVLITTSGHPAYLEPGPGSIPVGTSLPGEQDVLQGVVYPDGSLWYRKADNVWFSATGADFETRGDCAV